MKKALFHAIEAIVAILILVSYYNFSKSIEPVNIEDKKIVSYISISSLSRSINNNDYLKYALLNKPYSIRHALSEVYGTSKVMYFKEYGLRPSLITVYYLLPQSRKNEIFLSPSSCNDVIITYSGNVQCSENSSNLLGHNIKVVDIKSGTNNYLYLYIDINDDNSYTPTELVSLEGIYIQGPNRVYYINDVDINSLNIWLLNIDDYKYISYLNSQEKSYNGIKTKLELSVGDLDKYMYYDTLLITNESYFSGDYKSEFAEYLSEGNSIILISNHTLGNSGNEIFNIYIPSWTLNNNNSLACIDNKIINNKDKFYLYRLHNSQHIHISTDPLTIDSTNLEDLISDGEDTRYLRQGIINVTNIDTYIFIIGNNTGTYDHIYIDFDKDGNFSENPDNIPIHLKSYFVLDNINYSLFKTDSEQGMNITIKYVSKVCYNLSENNFNLYSKSNNSDNTLLYYDGSYYCLNCTLSVGDNILIPLTHDTGSIYTGTLTIGSVSHSIIANISSYTIDVDINGDNTFDYLERNRLIHSSIQFGPEKYVFEKLNTTHVVLSLVDRFKKPAVIYNDFGGKGKAILITASNESEVFNDLLYLLITWSAKRENKYLKSTYSVTKDEIVSVRTPMYIMNDFFEPFIVEVSL